MILTINYFGLVAEATTCSQEQLTLPVPCTVALLEQQLRQQHPALQEKPFRIAVNRAFAPQEQELQPEDELAVLPPFAGG